MSRATKDLFDLSNKVIIVTGGTGVLGSIFVKAIVKYGASVVILGLDAKIGEEKAKEINDNGGNALFLLSNVF
jgi:NAD(P)-dependent dehydrogenase (short-subunit alcohol dehydrogenase family)